MTTASAETTGTPELQTDTLRGDIRDALLAECRQMQKPWAQMSEQEQERLIFRARDMADSLVRRSVDLVAERGLPALPIEVGKITVDGGVCKGAFECYATDENLLRMRHLQGARAMFVLASPDRYSGERAPAEAENVGDLAMPKTGPGAPSDPNGLAKVGRGKRKNGGAEPAPDLAPAAADTSDRPFAPGDDDDRLRVPADEAVG